MFSVNRSQLAAELNLLLPVIERKTTLPILSHALFRAQNGLLEITATSMDVTAKVDLNVNAGQELAFCVPLKQLAQLVRLLEGETVNLTAKVDGRLEVKCGGARHLLMMRKTDEYPETDLLPADIALTPIPAKTLTEMIKCVRHSMLVDTGVTKQSEIMFTGLQLRSKDGKLEVQGSRKVTLALATCPFTGPEFCAVIPLQAVSALAAFDDGDVGIGVTDKHATFICGPRQLTARLLIGQFPDWSNVLPEFKQSVNVESESLAAATRRSMLTTNAENWEKFEPLKYTFGKDVLTVESKGGDSGKSHEQVPATSTLNGASVLFGVNGNQILEFLRLTDKAVIELPEGNEPQLVRMRPGEVKDVDYSYVVCGVTLKNWSDG